MSSETKPKPKEKDPKVAKEPKEKKDKLPRYIVRLTDAEKNSLRFTAKMKANGTAISFATHTVRDEEGKAKSDRGGTANHMSFEDAKSAVDKGATAATKIGWMPRGGKSSKGDVFDLDSLPTPKK